MGLPRSAESTTLGGSWHPVFLALQAFQSLVRLENHWPRSQPPKVCWQSLSTTLPDLQNQNLHLNKAPGVHTETEEAGLLAEGAPQAVLWRYEKVRCLRGNDKHLGPAGASETTECHDPWNEGDIMTSPGCSTMCYPGYCGQSLKVSGRGATLVFQEAVARVG